MMNEPTSSFPLLASDQADVMEIFLQLMQERSGSAQVSEKNDQEKQLGAGGNSQTSFPHELLDYE